MKKEDNLILSSLVFFFGGLVTLFGIDLHNRYGYQEAYETALHWHFSAGLVILAGIVLVVVGLIGMITSVISRQEY